MPTAILPGHDASRPRAQQESQALLHGVGQGRSGQFGADLILAQGALPTALTGQEFSTPAQPGGLVDRLLRAARE